MVQKGERIPCVMFEDNSVELFHDYKSARKFVENYLGQHASTITEVEKFGPNCMTVTYINRNRCESFITISSKEVG